MFSTPREIMMSAVPQGGKEKSFEESRLEEYKKGLAAFGKPPAPCPKNPTGERERKTLGLPPLFEPFDAQVNPAPAPSGNLEGKKGHKDLPAVQVFCATLMTNEVNTGTFQSISAQPEFQGYSPEELRYYANKEVNTSTLTRPIVMEPPQPFVVPPVIESYQSISSTAPYSQHSHEEIRFAYLQAGRPLTSAEIFQYKPVPNKRATRPSDALWRSNLYSFSSTASLS